MLLICKFSAIICSQSHPSLNRIVQAIGYHYLHFYTLENRNYIIFFNFSCCATLTLERFIKGILITLFLNDFYLHDYSIYDVQMNNFLIHDQRIWNEKILLYSRDSHKSCKIRPVFINQPLTLKRMII